MICALLSHSPYVTCHMTSSCDCDTVILSHVILSHTLFLCSKFRKEKKRNINNNLAILPSYDRHYDRHAEELDEKEHVGLCK